MKFEEYKKNADREWRNFRNKQRETISQQERDRFYQLYINWDMQKTNRRLVWATWILAIATIIFALLTIYFQHSVNP